MLITVFGDRLAELGGFRRHNPFRLYFKSRFASILNKTPECELIFPLTPGPGFWAAEVAHKLNRPFIGVMNHNLKEQYAAFKKTIEEMQASPNMQAVELPYEIKEEAYIGDYCSKYEGNKYAIVCMPESKITGRIATVACALRKFMAVHILDPQDIPPDFKALAIIEEVRAKIPGDLEFKLAESRDQLLKLVASGQLSEKAAERVGKRATEMMFMRDILQRFSKRS